MVEWLVAGCGQQCGAEVILHLDTVIDNVLSQKQGNPDDENVFVR
jgi:hypothetical protein